MRDDYAAVAVEEVDIRDTSSQDSEKYKSSIVRDLLIEQITDTPSIQAGYEEKPFYPFPQCNTT